MKSVAPRGRFRDAHQSPTRYRKVVLTCTAPSSHRDVMFIERKPQRTSRSSGAEPDRCRPRIAGTIALRWSANPLLAVVYKHSAPQEPERVSRLQRPVLHRSVRDEILKAK